MKTRHKPIILIGGHALQYLDENEIVLRGAYAAECLQVQPQRLAGGSRVLYQVCVNTREIIVSRENTYFACVDFRNESTFREFLSALCDMIFIAPKHLVQNTHA